MPLFGAAVGIILRGTAFALRGEAATIGEARLLGAAFALSSVLVPFFLGATIGAVATGQVRVPADAGHAVRRAGPNSTSLYIGALAVATGAYLAAVFLAADSVRAGLPDLVEAFRAAGPRRRRRSPARWRSAASSSSATTPATSTTGSRRGSGSSVVIGSAIAGLVTIALVWTRRFGIARFTDGGGGRRRSWSGWMIALIARTSCPGR